MLNREKTFRMRRAAMGKQSRRSNRRTRRVSMTPEVEKALKEQLQSFKE